MSGWWNKVKKLHLVRVVFILASAETPWRNLLRVARKRWKRLSKTSTWLPASYLIEPDCDEGSSPGSVGFFVHLYYMDYAVRLVSALERNPQVQHVFVSTPSSEISDFLSSWSVAHRRVDLIVSLTPNRGRNFGPLLVEFSHQIKKFDIVVHLHSKKSMHQKQHFGTDWANRYWYLLLENPTLLQRSLNLIGTSPQINTISPLLADIIPADAYSWLLNEKKGGELLSKIGLQSSALRFPFPAGGMFMARVQALLPLFDLNWSWQDFPEEKGQIDGTTQHAVERLIGVLAEEKGGCQAFYDFSMDSFTTEVGFLAVEEKRK